MATAMSRLFLELKKNRKGRAKELELTADEIALKVMGELKEGIGPEELIKFVKKLPNIEDHFPTPLLPSMLKKEKYELRREKGIQMATQVLQKLEPQQNERPIQLAKTDVTKIARVLAIVANELEESQVVDFARRLELSKEGSTRIVQVARTKEAINGNRRVLNKRAVPDVWPLLFWVCWRARRMMKEHLESNAMQMVEILNVFGPS